MITLYMLTMNTHALEREAIAAVLDINVEVALRSDNLEKMSLDYKKLQC